MPRGATRRCIGQLMERVLEIGEVELSRIAAVVGRARLADLMRSAARPPRPSPALARPNRPRTRRRPARCAGKRRAIAISQRPPPQWTSTTRPPRAEVGDELRQRRERLLEEDRDVLGRQPLDGDPVAVGALADRLAGPEEVGHPAPVERCRPRHGRTGRRGTRAGRRRAGSTATSSSNDEPVAVELHEVVGVGPHAHAGRLGRVPGRGRELAAVEPARARLAERREQAELEARGRRATCGRTRQGWRPARRSGRRGASRRIVACGSPGRPGYRIGPDGAGATVPASRGSGGDGTDDQLIDALAARPRRVVRGARAGPRGPHATRSRCACSGTRATPRRRPRTLSSAPTVPSAATTRRGSATCGCGLAGDDRPQPVPLAHRAAGAPAASVRCRWTPLRPGRSNPSPTTADRSRPRRRAAGSTRQPLGGAAG